MIFFRFQKSADQENIDGLHAFGTCYFNGEGVEKDVIKAEQYFQKAVDKKTSKSEKKNLNCD
jgi:TPR repeat protein